jgi:pimeloyl-ACP methyl ester carboxylesterase
MSNDIRWRISVPTLIINTKDDGLAAFENAARAAERIPRASVRASRRPGQHR